MRIEFTKEICLRDFVEAQQRYLRMRRIIVYILFSAIVLLFCFLGNYPLAVEAAVILVGLAIFFELVMPFVVFPYQYKRSNAVKGKFSVLIDDEGIVTIGETIQSKTSWDSYKKYVQTRNLILLYLATNLSVVTPKRFMTSDQIEEFMVFLKNKFG